MTQLNGTELRDLLQEAVAKDGDFVKEILGEVLQEFLEMEKAIRLVWKNTREMTKNVSGPGMATKTDT